MKTKNCSKFALDRTFPSHAVPPNSTYMGEFTIGSLVAPGSGVVIQSWGRKTPNGEHFNKFQIHISNIWARAQKIIIFVVTFAFDIKLVNYYCNNQRNILGPACTRKIVRVRANSKALYSL